MTRRELSIEYIRAALHEVCLLVASTEEKDEVINVDGNVLGRTALRALTALDSLTTEFETLEEAVREFRDRYEAEAHDHGATLAAMDTLERHSTLDPWE